jgi:hypothetical protein
MKYYLYSLVDARIIEDCKPKKLQTVANTYHEMDLIRNHIFAIILAFFVISLFFFNTS